MSKDPHKDNLYGTSSVRGAPFALITCCSIFYPYIMFIDMSQLYFRDVPFLKVGLVQLEGGRKCCISMKEEGFCIISTISNNLCANDQWFVFLGSGLGSVGNIDSVMQQNIVTKHDISRVIDA